MKNLNEVHWIDGVQQEDYSMKSNDVEVYFKNLDKILIEKIKESRAVIGCIAWFNLYSVLDALADKYAVSILIQKEDWLRPSIDENGNFIGRKADLHARFQKLNPLCVSEFHQDNRLYFIEPDCYPDDADNAPYPDIYIDPVRCIGMHGDKKQTMHPRMHHKFLVFLNMQKNDDGSFIAKPYGVWTGSFNVTSNATRSFENAVYIKNEKIAEAYMKEWAQLMGLSEDLDWQAEDIAPNLNFHGYWFE